MTQKLKETEIGMIPEDWSVTNIGKAVDILTGYPFKSKNYSNEGIRVLRGENVSLGFLRWDTDKRWDKGINDLEKYFLESSDIVIGMDGSRVGKNRAMVKEIDLPLLLAQRVARLRSKDGLDQYYLKHIILSDRFYNYVESIKTGTSIPHISGKQIAEFEFAVPSVKEQKLIGNILSSLDDKIDLNNQMNKTLEQIAQTLFKRWFTDFEFPDENGNPYRSSGGRMVDSQLGEIPDGWEIKSLYDCAQYINGAAFRNEDFSSDQEGLPIIKISELKNGITSQTEFTIKEFDPKYRIMNGEVLFSWSGSPDTSIDIFLWTGGTGWLNQHTFRIIPYKNEEKEFIFLLLKYFKNSFIEIARNKQTTGLGHVTSKDLKKMFIAFPFKKVIKRFNQVSGPIVDKIICNSIESNNLSQIRDTLLPRLISGKIRVPVAEGDATCQL